MGKENMASNEKAVKKVKNENTSLKKNARDVFKTAMILTIIAIVSGCLLGIVNHYTYISEEEMINIKLKKVYAADTFNNVTEKYDLDIKNPAYKNGEVQAVFQPVKDGKPVKGVVLYQVVGTSEYPITALISVIDNQIDKMVVVVDGSSGGVGDKAYKLEYVNRFKNKNLLEMKLFELSKKPKTENDILAVSGATKSSAAVLNAMNCVMLVHQENKNLILDKNNAKNLVPQKDEKVEEVLK